MSTVLKNEIFGPPISADIPVQVSIRNFDNSLKVIKEDIVINSTHIYNTRETSMIYTDYSIIVSSHYLFDSLVKSDIEVVHNEVIKLFLSKYMKNRVYNKVDDISLQYFHAKLNQIYVPLWTPGIYTTFNELRANSDSYINKSWKEYNNKLYSATSKNCKYKDDMICIACGCEILPSDAKQCDHLIPVIQAFISIKSNHADNEFNFLHSCCNQKKSNMSLLEFMAAIAQNEFYNECISVSGRTQSVTWDILIKAIVSKINNLELYTLEEQIVNIKKLEKFLKLNIINKKTNFVNFKGTQTDYDQLLKLQSNIMFNTDTGGSSSQFGRINNKKLQKETKKKLKHLAKKYSLKLNKHLIKNIKNIKKLQKEAKKEGIRITKKIKGKRKYKTKSQLIKELKYI